jgi:hypothetical protein
LGFSQSKKRSKAAKDHFLRLCSLAPLRETI